MSPKRDLLEVKWVDSCSPNGWTRPENLAKYSPCKNKSVGYLIAESKTCLTIAASIGPDQVDGIMCIPKVAITARKVIGK